MPREQLRSRLGIPQRAFDGIIEHFTRAGVIGERATVIALPEHQPSLSEAQEQAAAACLAALRAHPYSPPTGGTPGEDLLGYLEETGQVVRVADGVVFAAEAYREMTDRVVAHLRPHGTITLAQVRDMFGTSRKYAQALLEHMDAKHITRRAGDERVLR